MRSSRELKSQENKDMEDNEKIVQLLEDIKKLLVLALIRNSVRGKDIARVLGVDPAIISRLLLSGQKKKRKNV